MERQQIVWLDGEFAAADAVGIGVDETGFLQGIGVFETLWAGAGCDLAWAEQHGARLEAGCQRLGLVAPNWRELVGVSAQLRERNGLRNRDTRLRWTVTERRAAGLGGENSPRVLVTAEPARPRPVGAARARVATARRHSQDPLAGIKATSYAGLALLGRAARGAGWNEALYLNERGDLVEGAASNLFLVRGKELWTPELASGCLPGVTRGQVLRLAAKLGWRVVEERLSPEQLAGFDGGFLTNSQWGIWSLAEIGWEQGGPGRIFASSGEVAAILLPQIGPLRAALEESRRG